MHRHEAAIHQLKGRAMVAAGHSYSPYSHFRVGAAIIGASGEIYSGCNVENGSFGLTQCAERAAITAAICAGEPPGTLELLLIYTPGDTAHTPCGACRQVMEELMSADSLVVSCCDKDATRAWTPAEYLPDSFVPDPLKK